MRSRSTRRASSRRGSESSGSWSLQSSFAVRRLALLVRKAPGRSSGRAMTLRSCSRSRWSRIGSSRRVRSRQSRASTQPSMRKTPTPLDTRHAYRALRSRLLKNSGWRPTARCDPIRRALPRHRQDRRPRQHPHQARDAQRRRITRRSNAIRGRCRDRLPLQPPARRGADHPTPSRALGRQGVSRPPCR